MAHLIGIEKYKKDRIHQDGDGKLKIYQGYDRPPCFAAFWCNKHCTFQENRDIVNFLKTLTSDHTVSVHFSDGICDLNLDDPLLVVPSEEYIRLAQATRLSSENLKKIKNKTLCIPLDDDIFRMGLDKFLEIECGPTIDTPWETKKSIAFFRGTPVGPTRPQLVKNLYGNPLTDARFVKTPWTDPVYYERHKQLYDNRFDGSNPQPVTLAEHVKHKYLICAGGIIIGSMFNWIFGSGCVPILITHQDDDWWFKPFVIPYVHYIPVKFDLSNLETNINFLVENDDFAKRIANDARKAASVIFSPHFQRKYLIDALT